MRHFVVTVVWDRDSVFRNHRGRGRFGNPDRTGNYHVGYWTSRGKDLRITSRDFEETFLSASVRKSVSVPLST